MIRKFDVIVIGTGSAGSTIATTCRELGRTVAIIDDRPFGGTCSQRGCDPKKLLVGAAEAVDWQRRLQGHGAPSGDYRIDWPAAMRYKRTFTGPVPSRTETKFEEAGISSYHGPARFIGTCALAVGDDTLEGTHAVIAAGAKPAPLRISGAEHLLTSDDFLELESLPGRIAFIGGGYIAFEFAHICARAGVHATIIHRGERPLTHFDPDLVDLLLAASRESGIEVLLSAEARSITPSANGFRIQAGGREIEAGLVVHAAGRLPALDDLDLPAAGVERRGPAVKVNEFLQSTSNPAVYAAGDAAAAGPPFTPVAGADGRLVAHNLIYGNQRTVDYRGVASAVFTLPPLASVGLLESEAQKQGLRFDCRFNDTTTWYASRRIREKHAGTKVLVEKASGLILGAHLFGHQAEELINIFALAIRHRIPAAQLKDVFFAYPSHTSNVPYMLPE